jgi:hypothetical protein
VFFSTNEKGAARMPGPAVLGDLRLSSSDKCSSVFGPLHQLAPTAHALLSALKNIIND